jgi:hypothetical protein
MELAEPREYPDPCERYEELHRDEYEYERDYDDYLDNYYNDGVE